MFCIAAGTRSPSVHEIRPPSGFAPVVKVPLEYADGLAHRRLDV